MYYIKKCTTSNSNLTTCSSIKEYPTLGYEWNFSTITNRQRIKLPYSGNYQLEVWGSKGNGDYYTTGTNGGYAIGRVNLTANQELDIYTGNNDYTQGYNGGGARSGSGSAGAGATHIAKANDLYTELYTYGNATTAINYVYIVAGGAGGGADYGAGGTGGGINGGNGAAREGYAPTGNYSKGGTQTTGYAFGQGQSAWGIQTPAGGGGWYGGYAGGTGTNDGSGMPGASIGAGGGSGYLNTYLGLTNGSMENGVNNETGKARIKLLNVN